MFVSTRKDPYKEIGENYFTADEFLITSERDDLMPLYGSFTMLVRFWPY